MKRTPMKKVKAKRCKECNGNFIPRTTLQIVCGPMCAIFYAGKETEKRKEKEAKEKAKKDAEEWRAHKAKTREMNAANPHPRKLAQRIQIDIFNPWVRLRDFDLPCISCQKFEHELPPPPPPVGIWQAGHYKSRGARKDERFNPDNCHKQCYWCNNGSSQSDVKSETVGALYRINLIKKIGLPRVEALEVVRTHKYTVEELQGIKAEYAGKLKELKRLASDDRNT